MSDKRAIIDIGSNTVRLVVYNGPARAPVVLLNEKITPRLGKEVARSGQLAEKPMSAALDALRRYAALLRLMGVSQVDTVATAATRDAENGADFLDAIRSIGLSPRLLSGEEEAQASAMGVIAAFPGARGLAADLGGGSLELVRIDHDTCMGGITLPFGTLRLPPLREAGRKEFLKTVRDSLTKANWNKGAGEPLFIVGGSWRALALYAMTMLQWPLEDPHGFELEPEQATEICKALAQGDISSAAPRISSSRMATLPDAAALLEALIAVIAPSKIVFSSWGLREGLLYAMLDPRTRAEDPMLSGVADFALSYGVCSRSAAQVADWIGPVMPDMDEHDAVLRHGAAMLSLASNRTEPNLRAEEAMDWALRKRWIGLDTRGRAMIAMAVLANTGRTDTPIEFKSLATAEDLDRAAAWGLAIRLCRKLTACADTALKSSTLTREKNQLMLKLTEPASSLFGNAVAKDGIRLADWLGLNWVVEGAAG